MNRIEDSVTRGFFYTLKEPLINSGFAFFSHIEIIYINIKKFKIYNYIHFFKFFFLIFISLFFIMIMPFVFSGKLFYDINILSGDFIKKILYHSPIFQHPELLKSLYCHFYYFLLYFCEIFVALQEFSRYYTRSMPALFVI
jgi:hypothetical protein